MSVSFEERREKCVWRGGGSTSSEPEGLFQSLTSSGNCD